MPLVHFAVSIGMAVTHGGRLVAQALRRQGVQSIFTVCGSHVQAIYDGCLDEGIRVVDARTQQTAAAAAEGLARLSGRPQVCVVTAGPGVTNTLTALTTAKQSGVPVVCLGGAGPQSLQDMGTAGDIDSATLLRPSCKWTARVSDPTRLMEYVDTAFNRAQGGVPGPVYLDLPVDVLMTPVPNATPSTGPTEPARPAAPQSQIDQFAELLRRSGKPVFLIGSQLRWSPHASILKDFERQITVPIYLNGMARGSLPQESRSLLGRTRRQALREADLIVLMGTPLDFRVDYGRAPAWNAQAKVVQVDLDGSELGHNRAVDIAINADVGLTLKQLLEAVGEKRAPAWLDGLCSAEAEALAAQQGRASAGEGVSAHAVYDAVKNRLASHDTVITDGGDFAAGATAGVPIVAPQAWLDSGPFGALGLGGGYAMASSLFNKNGRTFLLSGDGAFGFTAMEFEALVRHGFNVVAIVGNNAGWHQVQRTQRELYGPERVIGTQLSAARYDQVVEALGGFGCLVSAPQALAPALDQAIASNKPACVNVMLNAS